MWFPGNELISEYGSDFQFRDGAEHLVLCRTLRRCRLRNLLLAIPETSLLCWLSLTFLGLSLLAVFWCVCCCSSVAALQAAGCPVQLKVLPGKCHGMINSEAEMRVCMQFWAEHLMHRPADPDFVEVQS